VCRRNEKVRGVRRKVKQPSDVGHDKEESSRARSYNRGRRVNSERARHRWSEAVAGRFCIKCPQVRLLDRGDGARVVERRKCVVGLKKVLGVGRRRARAACDLVSNRLGNIRGRSSLLAARLPAVGYSKSRHGQAIHCLVRQQSLTMASKKQQQVRCRL
jgi:hypothetical protein